jgi:hypothetical protein
LNLASNLDHQVSIMERGMALAMPLEHSVDGIVASSIETHSVIAYPGGDV